MSWALSTAISLLLRTVAPLIRRGLPHLAMAAMAMLVCCTALATGHGLIHVTLWLPAEEWPLTTVLVGLLGATVRLFALVGLMAVVLLMPLVITADCLTTRPSAASDVRSTSTL
ncbi:hypothetical protein AR457_39100 [Streptomyces agglomeratus]|uniref:hypothetical protein n=1 Tax=Streptomyces agglomeratus TaxID=285458 RepID=UPI00085455E4|nr:hypothetical protein [Streptomyces agglomeratus]OEJ21939.1 hypothetical protein AR457_39100 [Streptomyces agglomeratus]